MLISRRCFTGGALVMACGCYLALPNRVTTWAVTGHDRDAVPPETRMLLEGAVSLYRFFVPPLRGSEGGVADSLARIEADYPRTTEFALAGPDGILIAARRRKDMLTQAGALSQSLDRGRRAVGRLAWIVGAERCASLACSRGEPTTVYGARSLLEEEALSTRCIWGAGQWNLLFINTAECSEAVRASFASALFGFDDGDRYEWFRVDRAPP